MSIAIIGIAILVIALILSLAPLDVNSDEDSTIDTLLIIGTAFAAYGLGCML